MDTKLEALPPMKRFRLMQQQQQQQQQNQESRESKAATTTKPCLPAKKRREALYPDLVSESDAAGSITTYCLPAKKRVWALRPDLVFDKPLLPLDLNVEWKPKEQQEKSMKSQQEEAEENEEKKRGNQEEENDDDDDGIVCAICQSTDGDSTDPIVFCDGCDLMVHSTCYGNPLVKSIPEGDWFCAQCLAQTQTEENPSPALSCCLCPVKGGAMKPTNDGLWAHVVCAVLVPEVFFQDPEGREGIDCSRVPKARRDKKCYVCRSKRGCAIGCSEPKCPLWFHVTCGLEEDLCIEYRQGKKGAVVAGFCKDHTQLWKKQQQTGKFKIVAREEHKK